MKRIKRVIALIGVVLFVCNAPTTAYAKADSFILNTGAEEVLVVGGAVIGTETALGWMLSLLGFTAAANAVYENRDTWIGWCNTQADRFHSWLDDRAEDLYCTTQEVDAWLKDVANGALDTTSECWDAFLDYCCWLDEEITSSEDAGSTTDITWTSVDGVQEFVDAHASDFVYRANETSWSSRQVSFSTVTKDINCFYSSYWYHFTDDHCVFVRLPDDQFVVYNVSLNFDSSNLIDTGAFGWFGSSENTAYLKSYYNSSEGVYPVFSAYRLFSGYIKASTLSTWAPYVDRWLDFSNVSGIYFTSYGLMGLVSGIAIGWDGWCVEVPDVTPKEDVSDVVVAPDTTGVIDRDGSLDNVRVGDATGELVGVISVPVDGIGLGEVATPYISVPGVYPVDTVTGEIVGTDTPIEDVKPGIVPTVNGDYTITGLDEVFPFCVPFDLIALFDTLQAKPEAPSFKFPLPVPKKDGGIKLQYIEVNLSDFDTAATILRTMELLAFCVGLTLITRKLIRG